MGFVVQSEKPPYQYVSVEGPVVAVDPCTDDDAAPPRGRAELAGAHAARALALGGLPEGFLLS